MYTINPKLNKAINSIEERLDKIEAHLDNGAEGISKTWKVSGYQVTRPKKAKCKCKCLKAKKCNKPKAGDVAKVGGWIYVYTPGLCTHGNYNGVWCIASESQWNVIKKFHKD